MPLTSAHVAAIFAFSLWGLFPIYWKYFQEIGSWDLFAHRLFWSFLTLILILTFRRDLHKILSLWKQPKIRKMLIVSAFLISANWLIYIYAINTGRVLEASMGYFLNPILNVFLGSFVIKEKVRSSQWPAIIMAMLALFVLGWQSGLTDFPWIALTLSVTFAFYSLIRKLARVGAMEALAFETSIVILPTFVIWQLIPTITNPFDVFSQLSMIKLAVLSLSGLITCIPLMLFAYGAQRLPLSTLGFLNYLSPSLKFICGWLIFNEHLSPERWLGFGLIWIALAWYSLESYYQLRKYRQLRS
jgi:chloramphenicol-sensitive protein RarD